jgi:outer membrane protein
MKRLMLFMVVFLCIIFATNSNSFAQQNLKIATVNIETIINEMPAAARADEEIRSIGQKFQDTILALQQDLQQKLQNYQKQKSMMSATQQAEEEEKLQSLNMQLMQYNEEKSQELNLIRERLLEPIRIQVRTAIENVSEEEGFSLVLDKGSAAVLYVHDKFDITFRVLDKIKRGSN